MGVEVKSEYGPDNPNGVILISINWGFKQRIMLCSENVLGNVLEQSRVYIKNMSLPLLQSSQKQNHHHKKNRTQKHTHKKN